MNACPTEADLVRFLQREHTTWNNGCIETHVEHCTKCQEMLDNLTYGLAPREQSTLDDAELARGLTPQETDETGDKLAAAPGKDTEVAADIDRSVNVDASCTDTGPLDPGQASPDPAAALPARWPVVRGYEILEWLGEGGMGVAYKARHLSLNRMVALKMIRGGSQARSDSFVRFRTEAESVGRLRHPNIIQIYDIGEADGLPFVALELLDGGSLADRLAGNPQTSRHAAELVVTLTQAVRVAHEAGIIHRDLKPTNVLFTSDGVPRITDFGLAKRVGSDDGQTQSGQIMGSPSYMAPEQARGHSRDVGPAADVYALGAILYEMLTGRPPFKGATAVETVRQVIDDDPVTPSRLVPRVSRDLETICLKCLHKEPDRRYVSAAALLDDLNRFCEGRPIRARPASPVGRLWRWARREPTKAGLLAALSALFLMTVGGGLWLERQQAKQQGRAQEAVEAALAQLPSLRRQGRWPEAEAILAQVGSRVDEAASDQLRRRLTRANAELRLAAALERIRLTPAVEASHFDYRGMAEAYARAFEHAGLAVRGDEESVAARIGASDLRSQLVMALDHWAYVADALGDRESMARLLGLAQRIDPDPRWGDRFRTPALWDDEEALRRLADDARKGLAGESSEGGPPTPLVALLAKKLGQKDGQAEPLLRPAQARHPDDFWLNYALGEALRERKPAESVGFYRAALATRPTVAAVQVELGMALWRQGQANEAIAEFRRAVELDPKASLALFGLGLCLQATDRPEEAMVEYRRNLELQPSGAPAHCQIGVCLQALGRLDEAMVEYRRAIELEPQSAAPAHHQIGLCLQARGRLDEAMSEYRRAIELDPKGGPAHHQLGTCWQARKQFDEAMAEFRRAIELDPKGAPAHHQLGMCWQAKKQFDKAMAEYRRAIELDPKLAESHFHLGTCWQARRRFDEAISEYRLVMDLAPRWGLGYDSLADALVHIGRFAEARSAVRRGLELVPADEPLRPALRKKLELCERMLALDTRLSELLQAKEPAATAQQLDLARFCREQGRSEAAAGLYAAAFASRPELADDLETSNRYHAACAAARAAGEGSDGPRCEGLRRQALAWLQADLALRARLFQDGKSVNRTWTVWQAEPALASVRDPAALAKLPVPERQQWEHFWADVATLLADPLEQGRSFAASRQWNPAAAGYAQSLKRHPTDHGHFWFEYAALSLLSGDRPGYLRACARMIELCGRAGGPRAYLVARACTLAPDAVAEPSLPGRLAEKELKDFGREFWSLTEQGALEYRAGRFQHAILLFEQSFRADPRPGHAVVNWLWLALAKKRLGKADEARRWLKQAQAWLDQYREGLPARAEEQLGLHLHNWLEAHVLRREAEALIP
jgi:eukaryotic-like serine/threonine-protein kinase